ncbi:MAG: hypothetical protein M1142_00720 [Patescibacteria group bacterium]|nr:hypothetical protein [Patescibacteria group bacterium]
MIFLVLLIAELFILFFLSRFLTSSLANFFYKISKSQKVAAVFLAVLFLPGTIIHELAHFLAAGTLFVPVGDIDVLPKITETGIRLGSVEIGRTDILRRVVVGMAPVIVGLMTIIGIFLLIKEPLMSGFSFWPVVLFLYGIFEIANTMFSSQKDLEGALAFFVAVFVILLLTLWALYFTHNLSLLAYLGIVDDPKFIDAVQKIDLLLLVPLGINIVFGGLLKLLVR